MIVLRQYMLKEKGNEAKIAANMGHTELDYLIGIRCFTNHHRHILKRYKSQPCQMKLTQELNEDFSRGIYATASKIKFALVT